MLLTRRTRQYIPPLLACLAFGALLGWLLAGWPVRGGSNAEPWHLRPAHQARYVGAVAEEYARTGDAAQARAALDGWDADALSETLALATLQSADSANAERLAALRDVLALPEAPWGWRTLLGDPYVRGGLGVAGGLLALAAGIGLWPAASLRRGAEGRADPGATVAWEHLSAEERHLLAQALQEADPSSAAAEERTGLGAAAEGAGDDAQAAEGEPALPPTVQQVPAGEEAHSAAPASGAKAATWQPQPPATNGRAKPEEASKDQEGEQEAPQAAAKAQGEGKPNEAKEGGESQGEQQPGAEAAVPPPPEENPEEPVSVDAGLLDELFADEAEESMARHVLTRDLDEIDARELAFQAGAIAEALAHGPRGEEGR
jgi:chemotaxis protein histidine kinase CheA